jgi:metal-responsive CopG/Arc/MetJ family transcriptional regulator
MHPTAESIHVRLQNELLRVIEDFRRSEADIPTRPEAIRRLLQQAVAVSLRQVETKERNR